MTRDKTKAKCLECGNPLYVDHPEFSVTDGSIKQNPYGTDLICRSCGKYHMWHKKTGEILRMPSPYPELLDERRLKMCKFKWKTSEKIEIIRHNCNGCLKEKIDECDYICLIDQRQALCKTCNNEGICSVSNLCLWPENDMNTLWEERI